MTRYFNTEGRCRPDIHYMVRLEDRMERIKRQFIDREKYFVINRGRQYGKTTTLMLLEEYLKNDYIVVFVDFQKIGSEEFVNAEKFAGAFTKVFLASFAKVELSSDKKEKLLKPLTDFVESADDRSMRELFVRMSSVCAASEKPVILLIDEVDSASDNQVFIDFLAQLRGYYLAREGNSIFKSVILAGVYDIKNLKLKIRPDSEHQYNSPWNIAAEFDVDMSFSVGQITAMLEEYEADYHTGMDTGEIAGEIYQYTSGYPYLVSAICKIMDEKLPCHEAFADGRNIWTRKGIEEAVKMILRMRTTLFDSMTKHVKEYPDLKKMLYTMLFKGEKVAYNQYNRPIELACMFGYTVENGMYIRVANRIFETCLYNLFLSEEELDSSINKMNTMAQRDGSGFVSDGRLDMEKVLGKFVVHFNDIYGENDEKFIEEYGRKFFLLYLRPIINGTGNYYIEAQTRDTSRTDVVVDYAGEQFVIEMKIWRGKEYNERGEKQLTAYLDYFHQKKGYLLSFNFNKKKETGVKTITVNDKTIVEAVV